MSQQINLLNPDLLPRRDWLSLSSVLLVVLAIALVEVALVAKATVEREALARQETAMKEESKRLTEQLLTVSKIMSERRPDPTLEAQVALRAAEVRSSDEVLAAVRSLSVNDAGFSGYLRGFSKQAMNGLWLTEFAFAADGLTIKGRMLENGLMPVYIQRLNSEPSLKGRNFASLDMKAVEPAKDASAKKPEGSKAELALPRYTEFRLHSSLGGGGER